MDGALLIDKHAGVSSFGVIEGLQRTLMAHPSAYGRPVGQPFLKKRELPKMGHGGTLDPFATGLLAVCVGRGVKLARYFLGSRKTYEGTIRFGETTIPGDPTEPVSERSDVLPESLEAIQKAAHAFTLEPYSQTPPMHSAVKKDGKPLYELARQGIEVERAPRTLTIYSFEILTFDGTRADFRVECSSGTYVRTLAKDLAQRLGTVAMLDALRRTASGIHAIKEALTIAQLVDLSSQGQRWDETSAWVPFDGLLDGYERAQATGEEATALFHGKQAVLSTILSRATRPLLGAEPQPDPIAIYHERSLIAIARKDQGIWGLERVFTPTEI